MNASTGATFDVGFDIDSVISLESAEVQIQNPLTGDAIPGVFITLAGTCHPTRERVKRERERQIARQIQEKGRVDELDVEEAESRATDLLVTFTLGWRGMTRGGQPVDFTPEAARALYTDRKRAWLRRWAIAALANEQLFIQVRDCG